MVKAVGIYNGELFVSTENDKVNNFGVLRPVSRETLDELQDADYWARERRDYWVEAVKAGQTDKSLEDYFNDLIEEKVDDDEEGFLFKDDSYLDVFGYDDGKLRKKCDKYIKKTKGIDVGTWECGGIYSPYKDMYNMREYAKFDLVLDKELADKYYRLRGLK